MTGSHHDLGTGFYYLLCLQTTGFQTARCITGHGQLSAPAPATEILLTVGMHFNEMTDRSFQDKTRFLYNSTQASQIAGIMEGNRVLILVGVELDSAAFDILNPKNLISILRGK